MENFSKEAAIELKITYPIAITIFIITVSTLSFDGNKFPTTRTLPMTWHFFDLKKIMNTYLGNASPHRLVDVENTSSLEYQ